MVSEVETINPLYRFNHGIDPFEKAEIHFTDIALTQQFSFRKLEDLDEPSIIQEVVIKPAQFDDVISFLLQARKHFELVHSPLTHYFLCYLWITERKVLVFSALIFRQKISWKDSGEQEIEGLKPLDLDYMN